MSLQSRLLGVFAQYKHDPRVGIFTTEIILRSRGGGYLAASFFDEGWLRAVVDRNVAQDIAHYITGVLSGQLVGSDDLDDLAHSQDRMYVFLVPWTARMVANWLKRLPSYTLDLYGYHSHEREILSLFFTRIFETVPEFLPRVADWAHATHPNLMALSWDEVRNAVFAWHVKLEHTPHKRALAGEVVYTYKDGWTVQRLTTKAHLKTESAAMGHCVGTSDAYLRAIQNGAIEIYSIRDSEGFSVVTLEIAVVLQRIGGPSYLIMQAKLISNRLPDTLEICERIFEAARVFDWSPNTNDFTNCPAEAFHP